ncbi:biotin transporter BioY [Clostridium sediminicola]|uniref:biotin transporter BioY n=1 Tax=Clostridium sediminicola TaxID=3114879 RepID=UPI003D17ADCA
MKTKELTKVALGTSLIAIGAFIKIPSPVAGYFTLQLPFIIFLSIALGSKSASKSALLYMFGGLVGIPWFASGGGLMYIVNPTFGFIVSFVFATYIAGQGHHQKKNYMSIFYSLLATTFIWVFGMIWLVTVSKFYIGKDINYISILGIFVSVDFYADIVLSIIFGGVAMRIKKVIK